MVTSSAGATNWLLYDSRDVIRLISARRAIREGSNRYQQTRAQDIGDDAPLEKRKLGRQAARPRAEILRDSRAEKRLREKPPSAVRFIDRSTSHSWCSSMPTGLRQQGRGTAKKTSSDKFAHARTACIPRREGTAALSRRFFKSTIVPQFARTAESCPARAPSRSLWSRVKYSESGSTVY